MKTSIAKLALGLTLVSISSVAMAAVQTGGITNTKHNLGSTPNSGNGGAGWNFTTGTTEICVFCHTPHGADSSAAVPLWNRTLDTNKTYATYSSLGTSTLDSESAAIGSVSLACLSCHDGTQAMNVVINSPGGGTTGAIAVGAGSTHQVGPNQGGFFEFTAMSDVSGEMIYLGTDLRNDHPISIQYAGGLTGGGSFDRTGTDADFTDAKVSASAAGATSVYYIDTNGDSARDKHDLPLYNRAGGTITSTGTNLQSLTGQPLVECATCHDPHTNNTTFLRHSEGNNNSKTCLSCHVK